MGHPAANWRWRDNRASTSNWRWKAYRERGGQPMAFRDSAERMKGGNDFSEYQRLRIAG